MKIKKIFEEKKEQEIIVKGWVISNRGNKKIKFITINDGSTFDSLQVVSKIEIDLIDTIKIGASIEVFGKIVLTPDAKQPFELVLEKIKLLKNSGDDFPIQKNNINLETLREIPHYRHRTNIFRAVMRVRSTLVQEIHSFFAKENFLYVSSPIITSNDGEGSGEAFVVNDENKTDFFGKVAKLGVTGQLHAESYANGFGDVYTFGPTFRAENSHTQRHAAEFWMLEPEMHFTNLLEIIDFAFKMLKTVIKKTIEKLPSEFEFLDELNENKLLNKLNDVITKENNVMTYTEAIEILKQNKEKFDEKNIEFGIDLATEHEKFIANEIINGPVAIIDYPKEIKAFYMHQNVDGKTVSAFDLLIPGIGELIGGSQREANYEKIFKKINEDNMDLEDIQWYIGLRKQGYFQSSGFGLGFERLVMYVTGIDNIRDSIPFPRTPNNLKM